MPFGCTSLKPKKEGSFSQVKEETAKGNNAGRLFLDCTRHPATQISAAATTMIFATLATYGALILFYNAPYAALVTTFTAKIAPLSILTIAVGSITLVSAAILITGCLTTPTKPEAPKKASTDSVEEGSSQEISSKDINEEKSKSKNENPVDENIFDDTFDKMNQSEDLSKEDIENTFNNFSDPTTPISKKPNSGLPVPQLPDSEVKTQPKNNKKSTTEKFTPNTLNRPIFKSTRAQTALLEKTKKENSAISQLMTPERIDFNDPLGQRESSLNSKLNRLWSGITMNSEMEKGRKLQEEDYKVMISKPKHTFCASPKRYGRQANSKNGKSKVIGIIVHEDRVEVFTILLSSWNTKIKTLGYGKVTLEELEELKKSSK